MDQKIKHLSNECSNKFQTSHNDINKIIRLNLTSPGIKNFRKHLNLVSKYSSKLNLENKFNNSIMNCTEESLVDDQLLSILPNNHLNQTIKPIKTIVREHIRFGKNDISRSSLNQKRQIYNKSIIYPKRFKNSKNMKRISFEGNDSFSGDEYNLYTPNYVKRKVKKLLARSKEFTIKSKSLKYPDEQRQKYFRCKRKLNLANIGKEYWLSLEQKEIKKLLDSKEVEVKSIYPNFIKRSTCCKYWWKNYEDLAVPLYWHKPNNILTQNETLKKYILVPS